MDAAVNQNSCNMKYANSAYVPFFVYLIFV